MGGVDEATLHSLVGLCWKGPGENVRPGEMKLNEPGKPILNHKIHAECSYGPQVQSRAPTDACTSPSADTHTISRAHENTAGTDRNG